VKLKPSHADTAAMDDTYSVYVNELANEVGGV
jgi:hypothetical protein